MPKMSRRSFLKLTAATGVGAGVLSGLDSVLIHHDSTALAMSDSPEEVRYTHCVMCNHVPKCGVKLILKDGYIVRVDKREGYPNNLICSKGIASIQEQYNPERLLHPMKRTNPKGSADPGWVQITWEEALATIAEKLNGVKEKYGAEKVLFYAGDPKEPRPALQRLAYTFGSPNFGCESSTCSLATELGNNLLCGGYSGGRPHNFGALPVAGKTKVHINWATNPSWSEPFSYNALKKCKEAGGTKFIVVDPRVTPTVHALADVHLQLRPGTDGALALCLGNGIIQAGAYDKEFVDNWSHGFAEYAQYAAQFTVEKTAEICCVPAERIQKAIDILVEGKSPVTVRTAAQFPHHVNGVNAYRAAMSLMALTGSLDVPGGASFPDEPINVDGPFSLLGTVQPTLDSMRVDRKYFPVWADIIKGGGIQTNKLPEYVRDGDLRACFMLGGNVMMWPQTPEYAKAFQDMEFVAAADFYIRPWTHDLVDIVLPAAMSFERANPMALFGRRLFLREAAVAPLGEARPDYRICCDVGTALGYGEVFFGGGEMAEENCLREALKHLGVTLEELREARPDPVTIPLKGEAQTKKYELGLARKDGQPGFATKTGKYEFISETLRGYGIEPLPIYVEPTQSPVSTPEVAEQFPLILNTGSRVPMFTHSKERNVPWLRSLMPDPIVRIYPGDAEARGIADGDEVILATQKGQIQAKASVTRLVKPGVIDMYHGWPEANVNLLVARDFDPISGFPSFKEGLCQITKA